MLTFTLGDWRTNASLLGFIRILDYSNKDYLIKEDSIEVSHDILKDFEENYFNYFSDKYEKDLPWYRIVSYKERLDYNLENSEKIDEIELKKLNQQIDLVKDYLRRNNYKKVYSIIKGAEDLESKVKNIKKINLRKKETVNDRINDIVTEMKKLKEIIKICNKKDAKKHMRAKGVLYTHINRAIDRVSFLNPQTKYVDVFQDYRNYFIKPLKNYMEKEKSKKAYECFSCGSYINTIGDSYTINLVNQTGFDQDRKSSYIWNHISDILICPKCNFLYSMLAAGFDYCGNEGIFINYSRNIEGLISTNTSVEAKIRNMTNRNERGVSYRSLVAAISKQTISDLEYEENDIQIIRYKNGDYIFNILSSDIIKVIISSKDDLYAIEKAAYRENTKYFSIYDQVLDRLFNGQNMFNLIHFLLSNLISENSNLNIFYNSYHIGRIINVNYEFLKGGMEMEKIDMKKQIYFSRKAGSELRQDYVKKGMSNKINGISYRLLNSLKTRNSNAFIHNLINSYMYLNKPVPQNMTLTLEDEEKLGLIGYAFVVGLNGFEDLEKKIEESNKG